MRRTSSSRSADTVVERLKHILRSETGQMSVFVALIFQVLFVFFAMVINIGLVVHDKINLQNAVDLGAYYAAQKQAELLNEIAHINYQIRQDYKLLVWRYRVLGSLGGRLSGNNTPTYSNVASPLNDAIWPPIADANLTRDTSFCVANNSWQEITAGSTRPENYCYQAYDVALPLVPILQIVAPFIPGISDAASSSLAARANQISSCENSGPANWYFAMQMIYAYKLSIAGRKAMIQEVRKKLVQQELIDKDMQSVRTGVLNTVMNNLTESNRQTFSEENFAVFNGLSGQTCAGPNGDGAPFLPEIQINPVLIYTAARTAACNFYRAETRNIPPNLGIYAGDTIKQNIAFEPNVGAGDQYLMHSSLGYEKNPWCMAYMGVKARTQPRKPFAPFGASIQMEARAFAQPFGGRIGPWHRKGWNPGSPNSEGDRVDPLTSPRILNGTAEEDSPKYPNHSRFPGDQLGMKSQASIGATRKLLSSYGNPQLALRYYADFSDIQTTGDPLAWDKNASDQTQVASTVRALRRAEMVAVAPDVFDATYYSIDPNFYSNYLTNANLQFPNMPTIYGKRYSPMPDLGGRNGVVAIVGQGVKAQVLALNGTQGGDGNDGIDDTLLGTLAYPIRNWAHLLTGWSTDSATVFQFPNGKFGQCQQEAPLRMSVPGSCAMGGRTGYSVRLLSRDHLMSPTWQVGGEGASPAAILNKPEDDF